ncbi:Glycoside hydrolase family 81 protein [Mycena sanguinolenta]|uniref:glucan endo-1,3-beta-D-glucosidase n=1 Tax=Mycena sanguinolenta TaxID=230812 RepID=A0A8H6YIH1_9AGAR|nr:Glycoside hydrolase family 81 protein [Mycena sanguinolenta]
MALASSLWAASFVSFVAAAIGPIDTSAPSLPGGTVECAGPPGPFFQDFQPPFPTTGWWVGYAASPSQDSIVAGPFPYESCALDTGFQFGISNTRTFDGTSIIQYTEMDWEASYVENPNTHTSHKATAWDTQTVTIKYFAANGAGFTTYAVPGSPYITLDYNAATILLTSTNGNIQSINGNTVGTSAVTVTGTKFTVTNSAGTYAIYSLGGSISLIATQTTLTGSSTFTGVIRLARITAESTSQAILDQYSANYPTSVALDYTFSGDSAVMSFTWNVVGNAANLLHLSFPHHRKRLVNPNLVTGLSYLVTKGYMKPVLGNVWNLAYDLPTIDWLPPRAPQASCTQQILQALEYEVGALTVAVPGDFYYWGKEVQAIARLALIADHMGRQDLIPAVIEILEQSYAYWLTSTPANSATYASYETAWGGVVDGAGASDSNIDFGNGYYNDHHFHYGYFLHGAAVIANNFVTNFARDIGNPSSQDPYFTVARCRDWFAGHSWASGIANGGGSRDQESSGEAMNAYYGLILFADILGNTDFHNWARLLWATEADGVQSYWHLYPNVNDPDTPYPEQGVRNLVTMGNVEDYQAGAWLFWGAQRSEIAAIQILPVTPINEGLYDTPWLTSVWPYVAGELVDPTVGDEWKAVIEMAYGEISPQAAFSASLNITGWGGTTSQAYLLYHLATRSNPGGANICTATAANPIGNFSLLAPNGQYVTSTAASPSLVASGSTGTTFSFAFMPGGGSIYSTANDLYVTADPNGALPLSAARTVPQAYENFKVRQQSDGTYVISADVNAEYITLDSTGALVNNGASLADAARFTLANATVILPNPVGTFTIQAPNGQFVTSTTTSPNLVANGVTGTPFTLAALSGGGSIFNTMNSQFVTADPNGAVPLTAARAVAQAWETFMIIEQADGTYVISADVNSDYITLDSAGELINNGASLAQATKFTLIAQ